MDVLSAAWGQGGVEDEAHEGVGAVLAKDIGGVGFAVCIAVVLRNSDEVDVGARSEKGGDGGQRSGLGDAVFFAVLVGEDIDVGPGAFGYGVSEVVGEVGHGAVVPCAEGNPAAQEVEGGLGHGPVGFAFDEDDGQVMAGSVGDGLGVEAKGAEVASTGQLVGELFGLGGVGL